MSQATNQVYYFSDAYSIAVPTCGCNTYRPWYTTHCMFIFSFLRAYLCDIQVFQAFKGVTADFDALMDLLESIEHFLKRLDIYSKVPPTPAMTEIVVKILVELLSTLALATKQIRQGRSSESVFIGAWPDSMERREICKEIFWRE
jgi:hypothetical protein